MRLLGEGLLWKGLLGEGLLGDWGDPEVRLLGGR